MDSINNVYVTHTQFNYNIIKKMSFLRELWCYKQPIDRHMKLLTVPLYLRQGCSAYYI